MEGGGPAARPGPPRPPCAKAQRLMARRLMQNRMRNILHVEVGQVGSRPQVKNLLHKSIAIRGDGGRCGPGAAHSRKLPSSRMRDRARRDPPPAATPASPPPIAA